MSDPNYKSGVGKLVLDRFDAQKHFAGTDFRHNATQIDLSPGVVVGSLKTTVQSALEAISTALVLPTIPDATASIKGVIQLAGDISGTADNITVTRIQNKAVSIAAPIANDILTWNGSSWTPQQLVTATSSVSGILKLSGDLNGTGSNYTSPRVGSLTGISGVAVGPTKYITMGTNPATDGYGLRLGATAGPPNMLAGVSVRNFANTADLNAVGVSNTDKITLGNTTTVNLLRGALELQTRSPAGNLSIDVTTKDTVIFVDTNSSRLILLPPPSVGRTVIIKDKNGLANTNNILILQNASEKIEGVAAMKIMSTNWGSITLISDGTDWYSC